MLNHPNNTFSHPDCYAAELGGCSTQISKEHYVSDAILRLVSLGEPAVLVRNLVFQSPQTLEPRGISNLVAKVLCSKHNSDLSRFDCAGQALFAGMDQIDSAAGKPDQLPTTIVVNGDDLERWMLKTLCGGIFSGNIPVSGGSLKSIRPPKAWLSILFEDGHFPPGQGLYVRAGTPGIVFSTEPSVLKMAVVSDSNDVVIGFTVWVFNFEFTLVLASLPSNCPPTLEYAHHRPKGVVVHGSSKRIQIEWRSPDVGDELEVQWVGPGGFGDDTDPISAK
jgi:hypothetical protein